MKFSWMLPACVAVLGTLSAHSASAQGQQQGPAQYQTQEPAPLDKNYGLPTFGMPGSEVPQQTTTTPEKATPPASDFFQGSTEITLPKARPATPGAPDYETPLYTTSQGSTTDDTTASSSDTNSLTTGDTTSSAGDTTSFDDGARR